MGKTKLDNPDLVSPQKGAKQSLNAMAIMFGLPKGSIKSIFEAQPYYQELAKQFQDETFQQLARAGDFQREQVGKNFNQSLDLSKKSIEFMKSDPLLSQYLDIGGGTGEGSVMASFANRINSQLAARGISDSPVGATIAGLKLGSAAEDIRTNRLGIARSILAGSIPGLPGMAGTTSPGLFSSGPLQQPGNFSSFFGASMGGQQANLGAMTEISAANAQYEQQFKNELGQAGGMLLSMFA